MTTVTVVRSVVLETQVKAVHIADGKREVTFYWDGGGLVLAVAGRAEQFSLRVSRTDGESLTDALGAMLDGE